MLESFMILRTIIVFILPYMVLYASYIQINGEASPGGGFQAGVIFASSIIALDLVSDAAQMNRWLNTRVLVIIATIGVIVYAITGLISLLYGENYLDYDVLHAVHGQQIGICAVEIGVGLTVSAVMCLIYFVLQD